MFVRNAWYVAAWDDEIGRQPFARTLLDEPIVMYRKEDGGIVALEDRCCHRFLPLSRGVLQGDRLQCSYHGMIYDGTGACVEIPWQAEIPSAARVRAYPVVERHRWVWIWMGAAEDADAKTITDFHWLDDPDWGGQGHALRCWLRLPADRREPARPHPPRLCPQLDDRQCRGCRGRRRHLRAHQK